MLRYQLRINILFFLLVVKKDDTIRANLYLRQIPDSEMSDFVKQHGESLQYKPTRE